MKSNISKPTATLSVDRMRRSYANATRHLSLYVFEFLILKLQISNMYKMTKPRGLYWKHILPFNWSELINILFFFIEVEKCVSTTKYIIYNHWTYIWDLNLYLEGWVGVESVSVFQSHTPKKITTTYHTYHTCECAYVNMWSRLYTLQTDETRRTMTNSWRFDLAMRNEWCEMRRRCSSWQWCDFGK